MRILLALAALMTLGGCASDGYRYHDDGYYTAGDARRSQVMISVGYGAGCRPWYGPWSYPGAHAYGCGYGYGGWYGPGYYPGYGGYWHDPFWSQRWYLPPPTPEAPRAGQRARHLADEPSLGPGYFPRYEELAPGRNRDTGGGDRAWRESRQWRQPPAEYGSSRATFGASSGLSGASRDYEGSFGGSRGSGLSGSSMGSARSSSAGGAARAMVRESREEE
ncbi:MAG: hypothetical protein IPK27_13790 [Rhodanobacteraceae bacterium]|nr:hypothetical protein [Rhodanobacteraceae bacterium]